MLGEAFLHIVKHRQEQAEPTGCSTHSNTLSHSSNSATPPKTSMTSLNSRSPLMSRRVLPEISAGWPEGLEKPGPRLTTAPSGALTIPSCSVEDHLGLQLYESWCPSFCKDYPDLQLAGGRLGPYPPLTLQSYCPFLQSQDIGSLEALVEPGQREEAQPELDEGYLVIESMQSPGWEQRLTNSMLNGYLETQLMEVYRQHMQDSLARCSTSMSVSALVPTNRSLPEGQADGRDSGSPHSSVRYLSTCSAPPTSHFSSPVLRISYPQEPNT